MGPKGRQQDQGRRIQDALRRQDQLRHHRKEGGRKKYGKEQAGGTALAVVPLVGEWKVQAADSDVLK